LLGIVNGIHPPRVPSGEKLPGEPDYYDTMESGAAPYGAQTFFADLSYYRAQIQSIMTANANYSVLGDINLDGAVTGFGSGSAAIDDFAAFRDGWAVGNGVDIGTGNVVTWQQGDLNRDGTTNAADYDLLVAATVLPGDYNDDNVVDAGDYTLWRNRFGEAIALPNETASLNMVAEDDYGIWRANYGRYIPTLEELIGMENLPTGGGGLVVGGTVPEPIALSLALVGGILAAAAHRKRS
jgi:hypothetical protein